MEPYKQTKRNGKKVLMHRAVMEAHIGRSLRTDELVHHKNHDKRDNRIENLEIVTAKEHSRHHNQKHSVTTVCVICGATFEPHPTKRARQQTCGDECKRALLKQKNQTRKLDDAAVQDVKARRAAPLSVPLQIYPILAAIYESSKEEGEFV